MGTGSFPGVESGRGMKLTPHPFLVPRSKNSTALPLLSLKAFVAYKKGETYLHRVKQNDRSVKTTPYILFPLTTVTCFVLFSTESGYMLPIAPIHHRAPTQE